MKTITVLLLLLSEAVLYAATPRRVYINPGHGSWGPNDRPCATIPYPMLSSTGRPDTCGFYESNTNMWKGYELARRLQADGYTVKLSRYGNGPYPYVAGASNAEDYNRALSEIAAEVDSWGSDMFISIHSNATTDGSITNYPLFLYRGSDAEECVQGSKDMCRAVWPYLVECMKSGLEFQNYYTSSTNIRGDWDFYHSHTTNSKGYDGYLGVLKHGTPGFLSEGYFHTYQPARHRALNPDFCYQEGLRYYRGIVNYFGTKADTKGYIMGVVKDNSQTMDGYNCYNYKSGTHDAYMPVNGATVRLRDANGAFVGMYTVDKKYNGIFVFNDLQPGTYYIDLKADGYATQQATTNRVVVKSNATSYPILYMAKGVTSDFETVDGTVTITSQGKGVVKYGDVEVREGTQKSKATPGEQAVFTLVPDEGSYLSGLTVDGRDVIQEVKAGTYTVDKVSSNIKLNATFTQNTYVVTMTIGGGGYAVLPDTVLTSVVFKYKVGHGDDLPVTLRPKDGYEVKDIKLNKVSVLSDMIDNVYTIRNITSAQKFNATFQVAAGINGNRTGVVAMTARTGRVEVSGAKVGNMVSVTDIGGNVVFRTRALTSDFYIDIPVAGVYVVRVGKHTAKLSVR